MNPVVVEWMVKGIDNVQRGARTIVDTVTAAERQATRAAQQEAAKRVKQTEQEAKQRNAIRERSATMAGQYAVQAAKKEQRESEQAERAKTRTVEQEEKRRLAIRERSATMAGQFAAREAAREAREAKQAHDTRMRFASAIAGSAVSGVRTGAGRVAALASSTAGMVSRLGGGFDVADSVQRGVSLKGKLADIASRDVAALGPGKTQRKSVAEMEGKVRGVSAEFGIEAEAGTEALDNFASKTGDLQKGMDMLRGLGELSRAGVGDLNDLASAAGEVFNADKTQSADQVLDKLRGFAVQGAKGSVEMKDMASQLAKITAAAGRFEGGVGNEMATFGALAQLAKESGGAASPREAMTSVSSLANQFGKNARIKKMGGLNVDPKTEAGFNRPIEEVLMDMMIGAEKESRKGGKGLKDFDVNFGTMIADAQAQKATNPLTKAFKAAGGGEAGIAAAKAQLAKFGAGGRDLKSEFSNTAKARMGEADAQMGIIKQKFDEAVSTKIIPVLLKLVPQFEKLIPLLVEVVSTGLPKMVEFLKSIGDFAEANKGIISSIAAHPIGAIMAFEVSKSILAANIGGVIRGMLSGASGGGLPGVGGGAAGGGVGAVAGAGVLAGMALQGKYLGDQYSMVTGGADAAAGVENMAKSGDVAGAQKALAAAQKKSSTLDTIGAWGETAGRVANYVNPLAIATQYGTDKATKAITGTNQEERIKGALDANAIVDSPGIRKAIADAVAQGANDAKSNMPKTQPITARANQ